MPTLFVELAQLGDKLAQTSGKRDRIAMLAAFLTRLDADELEPAARFLVGRVFPPWDKRKLNVSWRTILDIVERQGQLTPQRREEILASAVDIGEAIQALLQEIRPSHSAPSLTIRDVYRAYEMLGEATGPGSRRRKERVLEELLQRATPQETKYIVKILTKEMRYGVGEGLLLEAIAAAGQVPPELVRRSFYLWGDVGEVARVALIEGADPLRQAQIRLFHPIHPMLAQTATSLEDALARIKGQAALEFKLDGARVQIHRSGDDVRIYSRHLAEISESLPDIIDHIRDNLASDEAIVEGEVIAVDAEGRPLPFQHLMRRFRRKRHITSLIEAIPARVYLFDLLYNDGLPLLDSPNRERWQRLQSVAGRVSLVPRHSPVDLKDAKAFFQRAYEAGHEGVMVKDATSPYVPGTRGGAWLKVKHVFTLDLTIVAAEWGYGRRHNWLSNYHLAARDEDTGEFLVVGKTFKGLTDREFKEMTQKLLRLQTGRENGIVYVKPAVVVEVAFNEIQKSPRYPSGYALRFARITRIRADKSPDEVDTIQTIRALYEQQFRYKGRLDQEESARVKTDITREDPTRF